MTAARDAYTAGRDLIINLGEQSETPSAGPLGRVIGELGEQDALALEVHQAFEAGTSGRAPVLPVYLHRPGFDDRLRAAVAAATLGSRTVTVVGDSSTGKTRACWEAIRAVLPHWRVWHPLTPERPLALAEAVRAGRIAPRTVIWLNEAQFYLQPTDGEPVAAELQALLADPTRGPVLVLGSMWPGFRAALTAVPKNPSAPDPHHAARTLLDQADYITAPPGFTNTQLTSLATTITTDPRLRAAAEQARGGRITQELAGAPELLRRYQQATPAARAVLWAAMDARRLGHSLYLPEPLLRDAAPGYLDDHEWSQVGGTDWDIAAFDELTKLHRRLPGPLIEHRARPGEPQPAHPLYRLADYLEQHARTERARIFPPASFWEAAARHAHTLDDLTALAGRAEERGRYRHAAHLYRQAADAGAPSHCWAWAGFGRWPGTERAPDGSSGRPPPPEIPTCCSTWIGCRASLGSRCTPKCFTKKPPTLEIPKPCWSWPGCGGEPGTYRTPNDSHSKPPMPEIPTRCRTWPTYGGRPGTCETPTPRPPDRRII
ncbi:hypothetical protein [Actinomadura chibensis]|uniref:hypothetical protein n=1 Tax=Actinomadura chibensis TaxID=392828 RepID=UPI000A777D09|nr:hypothetical protein [Actinomadura chibensis]